jgi:hypothetical protein
MYYVAKILTHTSANGDKSNNWREYPNNEKKISLLKL